MESQPVVLTPYSIVARIPHLPVFLGAQITRKYNKETTAVIAWGRKPSAKKSHQLAERFHIPIWCIEDGFVRSVDIGAIEPPLSLVVDDMGIYYDATAPSRLESLIAAPHNSEQRERARRVIQLWRNARISKYNHSRDVNICEIHDKNLKPYVLVIDQTNGDASIRFGLAGKSSFQRMLQAALEEHPDCAVLLKVHPDVVARRKRGHFDLKTLVHNPRIHIVDQDIHPVSLIEEAREIYTVTSQIGFEGLIWGRPVRTFGMPFYAGWGLTRDDLPATKRRKLVMLEDLVYATLIEYPRYIDPETGKPCEVERIIEWMGLQRRMRERFPPYVYAVDFSLWKKPIVRSFFQGSKVNFSRSIKAVPPKATLVVWGKKDANTFHRYDLRIIRLEDGFLRSVGLGADLVRPISWIADCKGIYYDATCISEIEHILQTRIFDAYQLERARFLRERIIAQQITKYNVSGKIWHRPVDNRRVILVPGQVENDASIYFGSPIIRTNKELLRKVRENNPTAYIIYKPHPDIVAGLRRNSAGEKEVFGWCDEIVTDVTMGALLDAVDEVHVITSLAGFEALLRGKHVVTYGQPFYAGWGLTYDHVPIARRTRRLTIDELTAGVLIEYPTYISRTTGRFTTPERALDELIAWREQFAVASDFWRKVLRFFLRFAIH